MKVDPAGTELTQGDGRQTLHRHKLEPELVSTRGHEGNQREDGGGPAGWEGPTEWGGLRSTQQATDGWAKALRQKPSLEV